MADKAEKLLDSAKRSATNFSYQKLEQLYIAYGFTFRSRRRKHQIVYHPVFRQLRATMPNHRKFSKAYVKDAVDLIERYLELSQGVENQ